MARVTVEDCVDKIPNRFDLVLLAAQRARQISGGAELTIDRDRDKNPVVRNHACGPQDRHPIIGQSAPIRRGIEPSQRRSGRATGLMATSVIFDRTRQVGAVGRGRCLVRHQFGLRRQGKAAGEIAQRGRNSGTTCSNQLALVKSSAGQKRRHQLGHYRFIL